MRLQYVLLCIWVTLIETDAAQDVGGQLAVDPSCIQLNQRTLSEAAKGGTKEAERALSANAGALTPSCAGLVLYNLARLLSVSGRFSEAEQFGERALRALEGNYPSDDPVLLYPLHVLASVRFELGKTARARETFKRMQSIRIERPRDAALLHGMAGALLEAEGRWRDAESEYLAALIAWQEAGRPDGADTGALLNAIGSLYTKERRFSEARQVLDRALAVFSHSPDAVPMDRIKALNVRAALYAREGKWRDARQDLEDALSIADHDVQLIASALPSLLTNYAYVLRKTHQQRQARVIEARLAGLQNGKGMNAIVDVSELLNSHRGK
jgi:tetratricopeptide (TPR) repeat protein